MTMDYDGNYGIFTKLGLVGGFLSDINSFQRSLVNVKSPAFVSRFTGNGKTSLVLDYIPSIDGQIESVSQLIPDLLLQVASGVVIDSVRTHDPLIPADLSQCVAELVRQMKLDNRTVRGMSNTVSVSDPSNRNTVLVAMRNRDGGENQFTLAETVRLEVVSDSYTGGASPGNEQFTVITRAASSNIYNHDYPGGSGSGISLQRVNTTAAIGEGNLLENGMFQTPLSTDAGIPDTWESEGGYGSAGVHWKVDPAGARITGNPASDVRLRQEIIGGVTARNVYAFHFRASAPVALTTGTLAVDLVDASGNILVDDTNNYLAASINLNTLTAAPAVVSGNFVIGSKTPAPVFLRIRCTTAENTVVLLDRVVLAEMSELYAGGPFVAVLGTASQPVSSGERIDIVFTRALSAVVSGSPSSIPYSSNTFQVLLDRLFGTGSGGFTLPYSNTPNISDTLIA